MSVLSRIFFCVERGEHAADLVVHRRRARGVGAAGRILDVLVVVEVLLRRLIGRVRRVEGQIEEERGGRVVLVDELHRVVAEERGRIALLLDDLVVAVPVDHAVLLVREVVDLADQRAVLVVEAALPGPVLPVGVAEVPLADDGGVVAGLLERLGQQPLVGRQAVGVALRNDRRLQAVAQRIAPGHQGGARRRAHRLGVELLELRALGGELVEVRRLDVRAVEADVLPAEIVGDDVEDVGSAVGGARGN